MTQTDQAQKAVFTEGSTMRHVLVMTATGSIGLVAIFLVDIANLFYIAQLGQQELTAAIGYTATIMFFSISICIGLTIAATALTARAIGAGEADKARRIAGTSLVYILAITTVVAVILFPLIEQFLSLIGAQGETHAIATDFMQVVVPSIPILGLGMGFSGLLRAKGDARRAMYVTLGGGVAAALVDPVLIFYLDMGIMGAAWSVWVSRVVLVLIGAYGAIVVHNMVGRPDYKIVKQMLVAFSVIAVPAVITQIATPVGNAYVTFAIADFGDDAVAGWAVIGRLIPFAFGAVFALSGAVGPILSQNYGARKFDRVTSTMRDSLIFTLAYSVAMWALLALASGWIVNIFDAKGDAASMVIFFCLFVCGSFIFTGALFVANAAFNNLGNPILATLFNWGRATLGVIPFVYVGANYGANGVLAGWGLGAVVFGVLSVVYCFRVVKKLPEKAAREDADNDDTPDIRVPSSANSPFTSGKGASA